MSVKMKVPKLHTGDIFITDSPKIGAKIVQFLATAPTIWHHLYWKLFNKNKLESMRPAGYHYGMVLDEETNDKYGIIMYEPEWGVGNNIVIIKSAKNLHKDNNSELQKAIMMRVCSENIGLIGKKLEKGVTK